MGPSNEPLSGSKSNPDPKESLPWKPQIDKASSAPVDQMTPEVRKIRNRLRLTPTREKKNHQPTAPVDQTTREVRKIPNRLVKKGRATTPLIRKTHAGDNLRPSLAIGFFETALNQHFTNLLRVDLRRVKSVRRRTTAIVEEELR